MILTNQRHIAHFDLDTFFVSVECLKDDRLKGKPVIIGGSSDRGVVASCSYEARRFGIHSAMPMKLARQLCPQVIIRQGDMEEYSKYSRLVTDVISDTVPLFEKASIDEFYVDLTGMDKYFGSQLFTANLTKKVTKESGLPISYALAGNKLISKVATNEGKPNAQMQVPLGREKDFLAPLSIAKMPGVGKETAFLLLKMGVETIKVLSEIPMEMLGNLLGKNGLSLWRKAQGIDETPVIPYHEQKSISTENTFQQDTIDIDFLHSELARMTEQIAFQLRSENKLTGCVTVKLRYSNFDTVTKQKTIAFTAADHKLQKVVKELFNKLFERRMLVRLVGVRFSHLVPGNDQINMFEDTQHMIQLYQAVDSIKKQFGEDMLMRGSSLKSIRMCESVL
jgi:DNA polymerase-4